MADGEGNVPSNPISSQPDVDENIQSAPWEPYQPKTYKVSPGTINFGKEYEYKMAALLSLRCIINQVKDMWMATNVDAAGSFDDIVLTMKTSQNELVSHLIQLKHENVPSHIVEAQFKSNRGNFSLEKYFSDIVNLTLEDLAASSNIYYTLLTNRIVDNNYNFFVESDDSKFKIINTKAGQTVYSVDRSKLDLNNKLKKSNLYLNNEKRCDNFRFLPNQVSAQGIEREIVYELGQFFDSVNVTMVNVKAIAENYIKFIRDWYMGNLGGHYYITKQIVEDKLYELLISQYEVNFNKELFASYECPRKSIWNMIVHEKSLSIVDQRSQTFLTEYIGNEVKKCFKDLKGARTWTRSLSRQEQTLFYEENPELREQMRKTVGNGCITMVDVYKCLSNAKRVPKLLEANNAEDYRHIMNVRKLSNNHSPLIIINKSGKSLCGNREDENQPFYSLNDLNEENRKSILNNSIMLQGRPSAILGDLLDEEMYEYMKCSDIISILCNTFSIGKTLDPLPDYYVARKFKKIFVRFEAMQELPDEIFVLENCPRKLLRHNSIWGMEDGDCGNMEQYSLLAVSDNQNINVIEQLRNFGKPIHVLSFNGRKSYLEWKQSYGSTKRIESFMYSLKNKFKTDVRANYSNALNIISANPGMGKSTFVSYLALEAPTTKWVIRINLKDHRRYYRTFNHRAQGPDHLKYFGQNDSDIAEMVFKKLLHKNAVIVLLDGFDQHLASYKNEIMRMIESFYNEGYPIWLTISSGMRAHSEKVLDVHFLQLEPFSVLDGRHFMVKYLTVNNPTLALESKALVAKFVDNLLQAAKKNLKRSGCNFTVIPLQYKLLADIFNDDFRGYISEGRIKFKREINLSYLYKRVINKNIEIVLDQLCSMGRIVLIMKIDNPEHQESIFEISII